MWKLGFRKLCRYIHICIHPHTYTHISFSFFLSLSLIYIYIHICVCVCVYIYGEMVDFGKSDKMIKISGKVDKPNTYNGFRSNISFFIQESEEVLP